MPPLTIEIYNAKDPIQHNEPFDGYCWNDSAEKGNKRKFEVVYLEDTSDKDQIDAQSPSKIYPASKSDADVITELRAAAESALEKAGLNDTYDVCVNKSEPVGKDWKFAKNRIWAHFLRKSPGSEGQVARSTHPTDPATYEENAWWVDKS